jgi:uncharacterized membrane protein YdjX (TVP38/TMEM64 family)
VAAGRDTTGLSFIEPAALSSTRARWRRVAVVSTLVLAALAWWLLGAGRWLDVESLRAARSVLSTVVAAHPVLALAAFAALDVAVCALCIPGAAVFSVAGGALFGLVVGTVAASFASTLGAMLAFLGARHLFRDALRRRLGARLVPIDAGIARDGSAYLFSLRLVPLVPFVLINPAMGLTAMRTRTFWLTSQAGMLPATLVYANAGTELGRLTSLGDVLSPRVVASLALLAVLPWIARLAVRRRRR